MNFELQSNTRRQTELFAVLLLFWILLSGSLAPSTFGVGVLVALVITLFFRSGMTFLSDFRFTRKAVWATAQYFAYFFGELVKANVRLGRIVLSPSLPINPGFVKVRTRLKSRMGRLFLANSITLTPGTLTVEMEGEWVYVHWITTDETDVDGATEQIVTGFEQYLEVMYG